MTGPGHHMRRGDATKPTLYSGSFTVGGRNQSSSGIDALGVSRKGIEQINMSPCVRQVFVAREPRFQETLRASSPQHHNNPAPYRRENILINLEGDHGDTGAAVNLQQPP